MKPPSGRQNQAHLYFLGRRGNQRPSWYFVEYTEPWWRRLANRFGRTPTDRDTRACHGESFGLTAVAPHRPEVRIPTRTPTRVGRQESGRHPKGDAA